MSKKKGMFSWLGLGKKEQEETLVAEEINENVLDEACSLKLRKKN